MEDTFRGIGSFSKSATDFVHAGVDIFTEPIIEKSSKFCRESVYRPVSENVNGPYEFYLPAENNTYIDCEGFRLSGSVSMTKMKDNQEVNVEASDDAAPINFLPGTAWSMKELFFNGSLVNYVTQPYDNIKAFIETNLTYGSDLKKTVLKGTSMWDKAKSTAVLKTNKGHDNRATLLVGGKKQSFDIPLQLDVLNTDRFLPSHLDLNIRLTKASDKFLVNAAVDSGYKIKFHDLMLTSRRVTIDDEVLKEHENRFKGNQDAVFPFVRTDIKVFNIPSGSTEARTNSIYRKKIPSSAIVAFVDNGALTGDVTKNPLIFGSFNISDLSFYCNSEKICSYQQDYDTQNLARSYRRFQDEIGVRTNNIGNDIELAEWKDRFNIYPFDFSPDKCNGYHDHVDLSGNLDFVVKFKKATDAVISMIILTHYDDQIRLDEARNVVSRGNPTELA